jgi:RNA polymerase sigma factor (sigma-70 family)
MPACPAPDLSAVLDGSDDRIALATVRRVCGWARGPDRDDARQVARLALVEAARLFRPDGGRQFQAWAILLVRQRLWQWASANARRGVSYRGMQEKRTASVGPLADVEQTLAAPDDCDTSDAALAVGAALGRMSAVDRAALRARFFDGVTHRQMAAEFGITRRAAEMRVARALGRLRRALSA